MASAISEFQRTFRYMMRNYRGIDMPPVEEFWTGWDAYYQFTTKEDRRWAWTRGVELGLFRYGHMTTGARRGVQELSATNDIIIVTHRPKQAVSDTLDWVSLFFKDIPLAGMHILTEGEPKTSVRADILIDDKPENCLEWAESEEHGVAVLFDRPWNQDMDAMSLKLTRAKGWPETVRRVKGATRYA